MSSSNPVTGLLANEKLTGDNFIKWKSNMNIVLICENHEFVFIEECLEVPTASPPKTAREKKKHEEMETAYEIWESLQAMFGQQSDQCRHEANRSYMNIKMKKGVSVREHVLNMINIMHDAEVHGATNHERTQVLNEFQTFESLNKSNSKVEEANVVDSKPSSSKGKNNKRKKSHGKEIDK
ncbi:uncharacterized protein LOC133816522 [Humulus lupulus]|uniref:uncharacterized protein LOC133816522 n=1 Tax=Humulus lupulus TaxID=3486 RepID=UPI002B414A9C|nr:uncharacterized protein LOC133816522 [Humulus lupulus]